MIRSVNRERITGGLTSMIREHNKQQHQQHQQASAIRRDRLLGISSPLSAAAAAAASCSSSSTTHELQEEDIWGASISTIGGPHDSHVATLDDSRSSSILSKWRVSRPQQPSDYGKSTPMNVPDWSKILNYRTSQPLEFPEDVDEEEDKENWEVANMPPHKLVARADEARSIRSGFAFSVVEGAGRKLKGWDLRRVRDGVWEQTGFP